jgi:uroporphyrinogen-III synthase
MSQFFSDQTNEKQHGPLSGRRVVVTRQLSQSTELVGLLKERGATVLLIPTIRTVSPLDCAALDAALDRVQSYDCIVFTSANAIEYFVKRLADRGRGIVETITGATICVIGEATAHAASRMGIRVALIAEDASAEGLLTSISEWLGREQGINGLRFLLPRSDIARDTLADGLTGLGAVVDSVETYRTIPAEGDSDTIRSTLGHERIDAITFTSPSTVTNFVLMAGHGNLDELIGDALIACIGPVTAQAAVEQGFRRVVYPVVHTAEALVDEIARHLPGFLPSAGGPCL